MHCMVVTQKAQRHRETTLSEANSLLLLFILNNIFIQLLILLFSYFSPV